MPREIMEHGNLDRQHRRRDILYSQNAREEPQRSKLYAGAYEPYRIELQPPD